jgi:hypothetical protein
MARNLADPDYEPTDEDLQELSRKAFAHVPAQNRELLARLRDDVDAAGEVAMQRLADVLSRQQ